MSALSAWMFWAVSRRLSPLVVEELAASKEMTSALRRLAAISKARRVRVLGSRKRLTMVLPRRAGTFFTLRPRIFLKAVAVAWIWSISARLRSSMVSRWRRFQGMGGCGASGADADAVARRLLGVEADGDVLMEFGRERDADVVGGDR